MDIKNVDVNLLKRYLNTAYKMGYDEIRLNFDDPKIIAYIQEILQKNLIGLEIINQGKNHCTVKSLSLVLESEFENTLRRIFLLLLSLSEESLNAIKTEDIQHLKSAVLLEENNNRFTSYCRRILNKNGYKDQEKITFIYYLIEELEKTADEFKYISNYVRKHKDEIKKVNQETLDYFVKVNEFVRQYYDIFYNSSKDKILSNHNNYKELSNLGYELMRKSSSVNTVVVHHLLTIVQGVYDMLPHHIALNMK
jgi:phosphate uptake regulator